MFMVIPIKQFETVIGISFRTLSSKIKGYFFRNFIFEGQAGTLSSRPRLRLG